MGEFFGSIYCWYEDFFGQELADYLWGISAVGVTSNQFIGIGLWLFSVSLFLTLVFYYGCNKPSFNRWWIWLIAVGVNAVVNFFIGWQYVLKDFYDKKMVTLDPVTNQLVALPIDEVDCLCFGVSNMLLSILVFVLFSFIVKWWSTSLHNCPI